MLMPEQEFQAKVRAAIRKHLLALKEELGHLPQTTHGLAQTVPRLYMHFGEAVVRPNPHSVSNLSQSIAMFLDNIDNIKEFDNALRR